MSFGDDILKHSVMNSSSILFHYNYVHVCINSRQVTDISILLVHDVEGVE